MWGNQRMSIKSYPQALTLAVNDVYFWWARYFLLIPFVWLAKPPFGEVAPQDTESAVISVWDRRRVHRI